MKITNALTSGFNFGLTSGLITALGLLVGLGEGTESKVVVVGAILTLAIADSLSDGLGVFTMEESEKSSARSVLLSSTAASGGKFLFTLSFVFPVLVFSMNIAIIVSVFWALCCLAVLSVRIAHLRNESVIRSLIVHIGIATFVLVASWLVGGLINRVGGGY